MHFRRLSKVVVLTAATLIPAAVVDASAPPQVAVELPGDPSSGKAVFEGEVIDLARGWGEAKACAITETATRCFRTEAQMDRFLAAAEDAGSLRPGATGGSAGFRASTTPRAAAASTNCSSAIRMYDGTSYTGSVLSTAIRWTYLNLANFGFDNRISSYRVGACAVEFYGGTNGSGGVYPGGTWAGASSSTMVSGWNNAVTSMYMF